TYTGHDPGVCAWAHRALNLWFLGYPDGATENARRSLALADQLAHPPTVVHALNYCILCHELLRDRATVRAWLTAWLSCLTSTGSRHSRRPGSSRVAGCWQLEGRPKTASRNCVGA